MNNFNHFTSAEKIQSNKTSNKKNKDEELDINLILDESIEFHKKIAEKVKIILNMGNKEILKLIKEHKSLYQAINNFTNDFAPFLPLRKYQISSLEANIQKYIDEIIPKIN